jgi:hypothetical protein
MKTISMLFVGILLSTTLFAQGQYEQAMGAALGKFGSAANTEEMQAAASQFERIAEVESEEWLPGYYASMIYCIITFRSQEPQKKEALLTQAQVMLDKAMKIAPEESEVYTLQGMIYQAYIGIDPARNGQIYSAKAKGAFQTAIKLNAENPRPYYLQAISIMHTPEEYGGGKKAALPLFEQAIQLFEKSTSDNSFYPDWGKEDCEQNLQLCKEDQASL